MFLREGLLLPSLTEERWARISKHGKGMSAQQGALGNRQSDRHWRGEFTNILTCFGEQFE